MIQVRFNVSVPRARVPKKKKHPRVESAPRDDRSSKTEPKRAERDRASKAWTCRALFLPRFLPDLKAAGGNDAKEITFYDSNTGNPLFTAPRGRSWEEFVAESRSHGWPSFRDEETNWDYVRVLPDGESVSVDGTHLGHNLPDSKGNRYCINLVSVAGKPTGKGDL